MTQFNLRFDLKDVLNLSERYSYGSDDTKVKGVKEGVQTKGYFSLFEFQILCEWKSQRIKSRCAKNDENYLKEITMLALSTDNERLRIEVLRLLHGVDYPVASVILHFAHSDPYPIVDFRALWSLGFDVLPKYTFDFWWDYTGCCRQLAEDANVDMRTLDRALWQFSKENQR